MTREEQVLVVKRSVLNELGMFQGLMFDTQPYLNRLFLRGTPRFMPRAKAEQDATYKQLIPYVMMTCDDGVLNYVRGRRAGETRLVGLRSLGIGGHINPVDDMPLFASDFRDTYLAAVEREVEEEVEVNTEHADDIVALINDDSNDVGRVHLGIVHHWRLAEARVEKREQMITELSFTHPDGLQNVRDSFETWSQLCIDHLPDLTGGTTRPLRTQRSGTSENRRR